MIEKNVNTLDEQALGRHRDRRVNRVPTARLHAGSVLIISLLFLLVISILAVASIQDTILQERMSGNLHDRNLAFQASEAALREGEQWLNASMANRSAAEVHSRLQNAIGWTGANPHGTLSLSNDDVAFAEDSAFYINPPTFTRVPGDMDAANPICDRHFAVFAHGIGGTVNARVTLQGTVLPRNSGHVICPAGGG